MAEMDPEKLAKMRSLADNYAASRKWNVTSEKGSGGSAAVYRVDANDHEVALKVYDPQFFTGQQGLAERHRIELQKKLIGHKNPNLVQVFHVIYESDTCFIEMEYVPWEELSTQLQDIPRKNIFPLITQLLIAVRYLDDIDLVHRDIKPHNILISPEHTQLKLIDLGVVRKMSNIEDRSDGTDHGARKPFIATAQYSSPEYLFRTTPPSKTLWKALTFYQIGAVLHDLITRTPLFFAEIKTGNRYAVAHSVQQKIPNLTTQDEVPKQLKQLAAHCLVKDLDKRLQLVSWDDFTPKDGTDLSALKRRIENLQALRTRKASIQQDELKHTLARREVVLKINSMVHDKLTGEISGANVETIKGDDDECQAILRFHVLAGGWAIDLFIEAHWPDASQMNSEAVISMRATLIKTMTTPAFLSDGTPIAVIDEEGVNVDIVAECIFSKFLTILENAVTHIEDGTTSENDTTIELKV